VLRRPSPSPQLAVATSPKSNPVDNITCHFLQDHCALYFMEVSMDIQSYLPSDWRVVYSSAVFRSQQKCKTPSQAQPTNRCRSRMVSVHSKGVEAMVSLAILPNCSSRNFQSPKSTATKTRPMTNGHQPSWFLRIYTSDHQLLPSRSDGINLEVYIHSIQL
jgi:hypothetical protein